MEKTYIELILEVIPKIRELIKKHYPEQYQKLLEEENEWFEISSGKYITFIQENIPLNPDDEYSIALYSILYLTNEEKIRTIANSLKQGR